MLYDGWTAGGDTMEKINKLIMTEHLIKTFPEHIQMWLRDQQTTEPLAAGRLADDHLRKLEGQIDDRRNKFGGGPPRRDDQRRHWNWQDRTNGQKFRRKWSPPPPPKHYQPPTHNYLPPPPEDPSGVHSLAPTEGAGRGKPPFDAARGPQCYNCKEYGHIARHCKVRKVWGKESQQVVPGWSHKWDKNQLHVY